MKKLLIAILCMGVLAAPALAQDVREAVKKAEADKAAADAKAKDVEAKILADKTALEQQVTDLEAREKTLENDINALRKEKAAKQAQHDALNDKWSGK